MALMKASPRSLLASAVVMAAGLTACTNGSHTADQSKQPTPTEQTVDESTTTTHLVPPSQKSLTIDVSIPRSLGASSKELPLSEGVDTSECGGLNTTITTDAGLIIGFDLMPASGEYEGKNMLAVTVGSDMSGRGYINLASLRDVVFSVSATGPAAGTKLTDYSDPSRMVFFDTSPPYQLARPDGEEGVTYNVEADLSNVPDGVSQVQVNFSGVLPSGTPVAIDGVAEIALARTANGYGYAIRSADGRGQDTPAQRQSFEFGVSPCGI